MKTNLKYYLMVAALVMAVSVVAQTRKYPTYTPMRSTSPLRGQVEASVYQTNRPIYEPFGNTTPNGGGTPNDPSHGPRRIIYDGDDRVGEYNGEYDSETGLWWDMENWEWIDHNPTQEGSDLNEIGTPIGAMPWMLMLLLCGGYAAAAAYRRREE